MSMMMARVSALLTTVTDFYKDINPSTLSGAIDILVIQHPNGELVGSPFHVRFGKLQLLRAQEKLVEVRINDQLVDLKMKVGEAGEAFFVIESNQPGPDDLATSPIPQPTQAPIQIVEPLDLNASSLPSTSFLSSTTNTTTSNSIPITQDVINEKEEEPLPLLSNSMSLTPLAENNMDSSFHPSPLPLLPSSFIDTSLDTLKSNQEDSPSSPLLSGTTATSAHTAVMNTSPESLEKKDEVLLFSSPTSSNAPLHTPTLSPVENRIQEKDTLPPLVASPLLLPTDVRLLNDNVFIDDLPPEPLEETITSDALKLSTADSTSSPALPLIPIESIPGLEEPENGIESNVSVLAFNDSPSELKTPGSSEQSSPIDSTPDAQASNVSPSTPEARLQTPHSIPSLPTTTSTSTSSSSTSTSPSPSSSSSPPPQSIWSWAWGKMPVKGNTNVNQRRMTSVTTPVPSHPEASLESNEFHEEQEPLQSLRSEQLQFNDTKDPFLISLCGYKQYITASDFFSKLVTYDQLCKNPNLLSSHDLVLRMNGKFYPWNVIGPTFASLILFQKHLPDPCLDQMVLEQREKRSSWRTWWSRSSLDESNLSPKPLLPSITISPSSSSASPSTVTATKVKSDSISPSTSAEANSTSTSSSSSSSSLPQNGWLASDHSTFSDPPPSSIEMTSTSATSILSPSSPPITPSSPTSKPPLTPGSLTRFPSSPPTIDSNRSPQTPTLPPLPPPSPTPASSSSFTSPTPPPSKFYQKSLRLTSDQLRSLGLRKGCNLVTYTVHTPFQGMARCCSRIFLWDSTERIVISDIDGTITKSDALGHFFTMLGRDWTHSGVASLYTSIRKNGYQLLYLTSRAIGQAQYTRNYLNKVEQGQYQLPDGPVFLSPDRLLAAFTREVIQRRPEEFKILCLRDIRSLFLNGPNPFHAGFGNRSTDAFSYRAVGVPANRIFHINPIGEVRRELLEGYRATYFQLNDLVDQIFPPLNTELDQEFNDWKYWKVEFPAIEIEEEEEEEEEESEVSLEEEEEEHAEAEEGELKLIDEQEKSNLNAKAGALVLKQSKKNNPSNKVLQENELDRINEFIAYPYL